MEYNEVYRSRDGGDCGPRYATWGERRAPDGGSTLVFYRTNLLRTLLYRTHETI